MTTQPLPSASQRSQAMVMVGVEPVQAPVVVVRLWPDCGVPDTNGADPLAGATASTGPLVAESLATVPGATLSAVTRTRTCLPMSAGPNVRSCVVAPAMSAQPVVAVVQRTHW